MTRRRMVVSGLLAVGIANTGSGRDKVPATIAAAWAGRPIAGDGRLAFGAPSPTIPLLPIGSTQRWGPNGNGTLTHQDDVQWLNFHDATIDADRAAGVYSARFGIILQKMDGQPIVITGYMLPVSAATVSMHFVLTRRSATCPFCPPNEPTEAIEIFSDRLVRPTQDPITVAGRLHLVRSSEQGLFFRIDSARIL